VKWTPLLAYFVERKRPVQIGLLTVPDGAPRGIVEEFPVEGFFAIEATMHATSNATGEVVAKGATKLIFHVDDVGWLMPIPPELLSVAEQATQGSALTPEERKALGLDE
jgi:hypothetical protein